MGAAFDDQLFPGLQHAGLGREQLRPLSGWANDAAAAPNAVDEHDAGGMAVQREVRPAHAEVFARAVALPIAARDIVKRITIQVAGGTVCARDAFETNLAHQGVTLTKFVAR